MVRFSGLPEPHLGSDPFLWQIFPPWLISTEPLNINVRGDSVVVTMPKNASSPLTIRLSM